MSKKLSILNYFKDLLKYDNHRRFRGKIYNFLKKEKDMSYDYGCGYFYQSCETINLSGLRSSKKRVLNYSINDLIKNKDILDVGTNTGFLLFEFEKNFKSILGIDYNPKLINMANMVKGYLNEKKLSFISADFQSYNFDKKFDVILSLANHSTFDKGIKSTEEYLSKCDSLLKNGGYFLIEGHHPDYEKVSDFIIMVESFILKYDYDIKKTSVLKTNSFYDDGRKFFLLKKK